MSSFHFAAVVAAERGAEVEGRAEMYRHVRAARTGTTGGAGGTRRQRVLRWFGEGLRPRALRAGAAVAHVEHEPLRPVSGVSIGEDEWESGSTPLPAGNVAGAAVRRGTRAGWSP